MTLLSVADAQARLLALVGPLPVERVPLAAATGRWLGEPVMALRDQPWADLSAMDGYALRHADLPGPWRVTGASQAGGNPELPRLGQGEAMRIFTGAPLPPGADCVLVQENAAIDGDGLRLSGDGPAGPGRHVRGKASSFAAGTLLVPAGTHIGAAHLALAATAGHGAVSVHAAPTVHILSTGNELIEPGAVARPGQLPASNGIMLAAMARSAGGIAAEGGIIPDDLDTLAAAFRTAATHAHIIVSTGGASVGDHDLVAPAILAAGGTIDFWKVAMRPGKPLMAGRLGETIFLGLPGNPVSAFVTATLFLLPLIRRMMGAPDPLPFAMAARTAIALPAGDSRAEYLRARMERGEVVRLLDRDSAELRGLADANVLVERPAAAAAATAGEQVRVIPI